MSQGAADDFVRSLREEISNKKNKIKGKRNILQDSANLLLEIFNKSNQIELRSIRSFEIDEIATYFDVYVEKDFSETISEILNSAGIPYKKLILYDYKCVFIIDLENRIASSGSSMNLFSLEVFSKRLKTYKVKIMPCEHDLCYSVYDSIYHEIKFWYYMNGNLSLLSFSIRGVDRTKKRTKIPNITETLDGFISFDQSGKFEKLELIENKRKKNSSLLYNSLNINKNE
jgi:hypothetical protein